MATGSKCSPAQILGLAFIAAIILAIIVAAAPHAATVASSMTGDLSGIDYLATDD
jgi:hypothetical protein